MYNYVPSFSIKLIFINTNTTDFLYFSSKLLVNLFLNTTINIFRFHTIAKNKRNEYLYLSKIYILKFHGIIKRKQIECKNIFFKDTIK